MTTNCARCGASLYLATDYSRMHRAHSVVVSVPCKTCGVSTRVEICKDADGATTIGHHTPLPVKRLPAPEPENKRQERLRQR